MNRYTFKAKRKDNQEWIYGNLIECSTKVYLSPKTDIDDILEDGLFLARYAEIDSTTLCQWLFNYKNHDYYENDLIEVIGEIDNGLEMYEDRGILTLKLNKEYFNTPALYDEKDNNNLCLEDVFSDEYGLEYNNLGNKFDKEVDTDE